MIDMGLERKQHFESEISHFLHYRCVDFNYYKDDLFLSCEKQCIFVLFLYVVKKSFTKKVILGFLYFPMPNLLRS